MSKQVQKFLRISATPPLFDNDGVFSIQQANTSQAGSLSSTDWNTFNNKLSASTGNFIINPEALVDSSNWNLYNDSPNSAPAFGTTQDLTYTAVASGSAGNGIIIDYAHNAAYPSNAPFINVISPTHITITYKFPIPH